MTEETVAKHELDPKFAAVIHAMMDLVGALEHFGDPEQTVMAWTVNERAQAFDYFRASVRGFAPWFTAFAKAKKKRAAAEMKRAKAERKRDKERK